MSGAGAPIKPGAGLKLGKPGSSLIRPGAQLAARVAVSAPAPANDDDEYDIPLSGPAAGGGASQFEGSSGTQSRAKRPREYDDDEQNDYDYDDAALASGAGRSQRSRAGARSSSAYDEDDDEYGSAGAGAGSSRPASGAARGIGAIVPYTGGAGSSAGAIVPGSQGAAAAAAAAGAGGGAGSGAGAVALVVPARPIAITKHGIRQFVESQHGLRLYLQNCVSSCDLSCNPDLAHLATHARNIEYNPRRFSAAILRLQEPKCTALVFHSGKMVITGNKNEDDSLLAARKIAKILQKLSFAAALRDFKIQNIVGTGDCGFPIRLEGLADEHVRFSSYEPELFPGLIYRMESPKIVVLVFVSGKIVLTGAKFRGALIEGLNKIYPILFKYRKAPTATGAGAGASAGGGASSSASAGASSAQAKASAGAGASSSGAGASSSSGAGAGASSSGSGGGVAIGKPIMKPKGSR